MFDSTMDLAFKLNMAHKLSLLLSFAMHRVLPSTATPIMALGESPIIGFAKTLITPDIPVASRHPYHEHS